MCLAYRRRREQAYEQGREEFARFAAQPTFRDFVCLYVAEGYKRQRNTVSLCNSDARVVRLAAGWIRLFARNPVTYHVQYHADQELGNLREFWAAELEIRTDDIRLQRKSNSNQLSGRIWRSAHGVLTVRSCDTLLRARLQGWMDCLQADWDLPGVAGPDVRRTYTASIGA
jgi:hypothetical protein